jgi:hypothetical protein
MIESEKTIEKKLNKSVKDIGGWVIKLLPFLINGLPDRLVLYKGRAIFVELKSTGKEPEPLQLAIHRKLKRYGFEVHVIDSSEGVINFVNSLEL